MKKRFCLGILAFFILVSISSAGDIWVYDANGNQLGILVGLNDSYLDVFIPSLNRITGIVIGGEGEMIPTNRGTIIDYSQYGWTYFNSSDCTGPAGLNEPVEKLVRYQDGKNDFHYGYAESTPNPSAFSYRLDGFSKSCVAMDRQAFAITEVVEAEIPFPLPIALPITYQHQADTKSNNGKPPK